jgi:hypothetical protein
MLFSDLGVLDDTTRRLRDGVEGLNVVQTNFDYVHRQLTFLDERVKAMRAAIAEHRTAAGKEGGEP